MRPFYLTHKNAILNLNHYTSEKGNALTIIAPAVADKQGGKANILIKTSSEEEISLDYYWGKDLSLNETKPE